MPSWPCIMYFVQILDAAVMRKRIPLLLIRIRVCQYELIVFRTETKILNFGSMVVDFYISFYTYMNYRNNNK